jgi:iron complex outermembrane recepter protein
VDASLFHIDYTDIQLSIRDPITLLTYTGNGSAAKSQGVELSVTSRPATGLTLGGWVSYNIAELTEPLPSVSTARGAKGDRLPTTSRFSGHLSVDQDFPLSGSVVASLGGAVSYVGDRLGIFTGGAPRQQYPSYTKADLRARVLYDTWIFNLFVDNVTDERGLLFSDTRGATPVFFPIQPRTVGLNVTKSF